MSTLQTTNELPAGLGQQIDQKEEVPRIVLHLWVSLRGIYGWTMYLCGLFLSMVLKTAKACYSFCFEALYWLLESIIVLLAVIATSVGVIAILDVGLWIIRGSSHQLILRLVYSTFCEPWVRTPFIWVLSFTSYRVQCALQGVHGVYTLFSTRAALVLTKPMPGLEAFSFTVPCSQDTVAAYIGMYPPAECTQTPLVWHVLLLLAAVLVYTYLIWLLMIAFHQWRFDLKYGKTIPVPIAATEMKSTGNEVSSASSYYVSMLSQPKHIVKIVQLLGNNVSRVLGIGTVVTIDGRRFMVTAKHVTDTAGMKFRKNGFGSAVVVKSNLYMVGPNGESRAVSCDGLIGVLVFDDPIDLIVLAPSKAQESIWTTLGVRAAQIGDRVINGPVALPVLGKIITRLTSQNEYIISPDKVIIEENGKRLVLGDINTWHLSYGSVQPNIEPRDPIAKSNYESWPGTSGSPVGVYQCSTLVKVVGIHLGGVLDERGMNYNRFVSISFIRNIISRLFARKRGTLVSISKQDPVSVKESGYYKTTDDGAVVFVDHRGKFYYLDGQGEDSDFDMSFDSYDSEYDVYVLDEDFDEYRDLSQDSEAEAAKDAAERRYYGINSDYSTEANKVEVRKEVLIPLNNKEKEEEKKEPLPPFPSVLHKAKQDAKNGTEIVTKSTPTTQKETSQIDGTNSSKQDIAQDLDVSKVQDVLNQMVEVVSKPIPPSSKQPSSTGVKLKKVTKMTLEDLLNEMRTAKGERHTALLRQLTEKHLSDKSLKKSKKPQGKSSQKKRSNPQSEKIDSSKKA